MLDASPSSNSGNWRVGVNPLSSARNPMEEYRTHLVSFAWWITGKGGKTSYPLTIIRFSCQGFFLIKSLGLTKQSCNYILQFLWVRRLSRVLADWRIEWCGCWEYSLLIIVMDRYDGQSNIIATNIGKIWQPVSGSELGLQIYHLPWRWELLTTFEPWTHK